MNKLAVNRTVSCLLVFLSLQTGAEMPLLKLPFSPGTPWGISTSYGGSSTHQGPEFYAIDFNIDGGLDQGRLILAASAGVVELVSHSETGFGNSVVLNHGNGWKTRYAHLQTVVVEKNEQLLQGQRIGTCGSTGNSSGPHLHFTLYQNGVSVKPEPMSGYSDFIVGRMYSSDNTETFQVVYQYPTAIQFENSWNEVVHGFAVTPLYQWGNLLRQDFQHTVMTFNPSVNAVIVDGSNWICPGMTENGWNPSISPYFVAAYNEHGRASTFGNAFSDAGNSRRAHLWGEYWIHNWNGGSLGECAVMLDPNSTVGRKQAAPIHGILWNWFRFNGGPYYTLPNGNNLGCPVESEQYAAETINNDVIQYVSNGYLYGSLFGGSWTVSAHTNGVFDIASVPDGGTGGAPIEDLVLWGVADGATGIYINWDYPSPLFEIYRDGVFIATSTGNGYSDFPLQPNSNYNYQVVAVTHSGEVLAESNLVKVVTEPVLVLSPDPDPVPTYIQLQLVPVMEFNTGQQASWVVYDQYGNVMTGVPVLFLSSDSSKGVVLPELGWLWGQGLGQFDVWAELENARHIKSERVTVSVVEEYQDEPVAPQSYPPAEFIQLAHDIEILTPAPLVTPFWGTWGVTLQNPTNVTQSFEGPSVLFLDAAGNVVGVSSYMGGVQSLAPGEEKRFVFQGSFSSSPGNYYLAAVIKPVGSGLDDWLVVEQTVPGVSNRKAMQVVSLADLRAELETRHFKPVLNAEGKLLSDNVKMYVMLLQSGDLDITVPFEVKVVLTGNGVNQTLSQTVNGLNMGWPKHLYFDFSPLPAGVYKAELFVDPDNMVAEYNKADNTKTIIVEVLPVPQPNVSIQINIAGSYRVGDVALGTGAIANQGQVDTGRVDYRITDGTSVVDGFVDNIPAGGSVPINFSLPLSQAGDVVVLAVVDPNNTLAESNELDNDDVVTLDVLPALKPDVVVESLVASPSNFSLGGNTTLSVTVSEINGVAALASVLKLNIDGLIIRVNIPSLPANGSYQFIYVYTPTTVGTKTIAATVDADNVIAEEVETNNGTLISVTVTQPSAPELHRRSTSYSGNRKNGAVNYNVSVENTGQVSSGAFTVKVVVPEIGKVLTQKFTGLSAGAFGSKSFSFKTPYRGQLTFQVTIDSAAQVVESNETNNYFEELYAL